MAGQLEPISQYDYSSGLNAVTNPVDLGPKQSQRITNLILDEHGSLRTVDGTLILSTSPSSGAGERIILPTTWQPVNYIALTMPLQKLVITRPSTGSSKLWDWTTTPWTYIGAFDTNSVDPSAAILNNTMVISDGYEVPKAYTGIPPLSLIDLPGWPTPSGAKYIIQRQGFLYGFNTYPYTTANDGPSLLRQSDFNNPGSWNLVQQTFIAKDDGQEGRGLAVFTIAESGIPPTDTLIIFKDRSTYQMTGNLGTGGGLVSSNFGLQMVKTDMGCYSSKSIQFLAGFGVLRLTHRGFAMFDGVDDRLISEEIRPYLFGRDEITSIDWTYSEYSWSAQSQNPPIYVCFCPTSGTNLTRAFLYDLIRKAWTVVDLPFSVASCALLTNLGSLPTFVLGDSPASGVTGTIRRWFAQDANWDGTTINWQLRSKLGFLGNPLHPSYFRRLLLYILPDSAATIAHTITFNGGLIKGPTTQTMQAASSPSILTVDLDVSDTNAYFDLSGSGRVRIRGHEWHARRKPMRSFNR